MGDTRPPLEYLVSCSASALESMELARLNQASNLRKELSQVLEEWVNCEADARLARWVLECRRAPRIGPPNCATDAARPVAPQQFSMTFPLSMKELVRATANTTQPSVGESNQQKLVCTNSVSGCTDPQTEIRKPAHAELSGRSRKSCAAQMADIPKAVSEVPDMSEPSSSAAAETGTARIQTLERAAHSHPPKLLGSSRNAANKPKDVRRREPRKSDTASRHRVLRTSIRQRGTPHQGFAISPKNLGSGGSPSCPSSALGVIEMTPPRSLQAIPVSVCRETPMYVRACSARHSPLPRS